MPTGELHVPPEPGRPAGGWGAVGIGLLAAAALLSSWTPVSAPFGLAVGAAVAGLGWRARRRGAGRGALAAAALGAAAALASGVVLLRAAGAVTSGLAGAPVVKGRSPEEARAALEEAARRSAAARERATRQIPESRQSAKDDGRLKRDGAARKPESQ